MQPQSMLPWETDSVVLLTKCNSHELLHGERGSEGGREGGREGERGGSIMG